MPKTDHFKSGNHLPTEDELRVYMESLLVDGPYRSSEHFEYFQNKWRRKTQSLALRHIVAAELFWNDNSKFSIPDWEEQARSINTQVDTQLEGVSIGDNHFRRTRITRADQLYSTSMFWQRVFSDFRFSQERRLVIELKATNHLAVRSDPEIREEIELRRKQYPNQQIFLFVGNLYNNYFYGIGIEKTFLQCPILILPASTDLYDRIGLWESAIIAKNQIRSRYSLGSCYSIERVPRRWKIDFHIWMKQVFKIDPREEDSKVINEGQTRNRFDSLDI